MRIHKGSVRRASCDDSDSEPDLQHVVSVDLCCLWPLFVLRIADRFYGFSAGLVSATDWVQFGKIRPVI